jgi:hypothetical protein
MKQLMNAQSRVSLTSMKPFSQKGFTLIESLSMMVTLIVFGWLCVAVVRYHLRPDLHPSDKPIFATPERIKGDSKEPKTPAAPQGSDDKPWQKMLPPAPATTPAPSPASTPAKP